MLKYGLDSLVQLGQLIACFYLVCLLVIFVVLGSIVRVNGFSIFRFIVYIKEALLIVLELPLPNRGCRAC